MKEFDEKKNSKNIDKKLQSNTKCWKNIKKILKIKLQTYKNIYINFLADEIFDKLI